MSGHIKSIVPQRGGVSPIDNNTVFYAPFDKDAKDVLRGVKPNGYSQCLRFNTTGAKEYIETSVVLPDNGTIELWYYPFSFYDFNSIWENSMNADDWECWIYASGILRARASSSSTVSYTLPSANKWYHIAFTWEKTGNTSLIVDGVLRETKATVWVTPQRLTLGGKQNTKSQGKMSDVRVWNSARTETEILENMNVLRLDDTADLLANWSLNELEGPIAYDYSPTGSDAIVTGGSWVEGRSIYSFINGYPDSSGKGVLIEEGTTNLFTSPFLTNNPNTTVGSSNLQQETFVVEGRLMEGITLVQGLTTDIITLQMPHSSVTSLPIFSAYMKSTIANPLKTQVKCTVGGINYWLLNDNTWTTSVAEKSNVFNEYTNIGNWQRVSFIIPTFPVGTLESFAFSNGFYRTASGTTSFANIQLEQKPFITSFVNGVRGDSSLQYPNPISKATDFTVSLWVKMMNKSATSGDAILGIENGVNIDNLWIDWETNRTTLRTFTYGTNGVVNLTSTTGIVPTEWNYIAVVGTQFSLSLYVNGIKTSETAITNPYKIVGDISIGRRKSITSYGNLIMDELRIDKVARTDAEILAWYYQGRNGW